MTHIPESRTYVHLTCQTLTGVDGEHFLALSNPFNSREATWCNHCNDGFPLEQFVWQDTGERISDYHDRLRDKVPAWAQTFVSGTGFIAFAMGGLAIGVAGGIAVNVLAEIKGWLALAAPIAGVVIGLFLAAVAFGQILGSSLAKYHGVEDWRMLR